MIDRKTVKKRLYWILSDLRGRADDPRPDVLDRLLNDLDIYGELYIVSEDLEADRKLVEGLMERSAAHLDKWGFCRLDFRPVHPVRPGRLNGIREVYSALLERMKPFHKEALVHQMASRIMTIPVLRIDNASDPSEVKRLLEYMREWMMVPSLSIRPSPRLEQWTSLLDTERERVLLEEQGGPLETVVLHNLFDDLLQWAQSSAGGFSLEPCTSVVVDAVEGTVFQCPGKKAVPLDRLEEWLQTEDSSGCLSCWTDLPERIEPALKWNRREEEGARVEHQLGVFALSEGDFDRAQKHLSRSGDAAASQDLKGDSLLYLGILHLQKDRIDEAHEALSEAKELLPQSSEVLYHLARCEFHWRDYIVASDLFHEAFDMGVLPDIEEDLLLYLGISHIHLDEFSEALDALKRAHNPGNGGDVKPPVLFYEGMALLGMEKLDEAMGRFEAALAAGPQPEDLASVHFYVAHCLKEKERWGESVDHLNKAVDADPGSYEAWNLLGFCRFKMKMHKEAIAAFHNALEIKPRSAMDHANIASNLRDIGDLGGAAEWYRKALKINPTLDFALSNLEKIEKASNS